MIRVNFYRDIEYGGNAGDEPVIAKVSPVQIVTIKNKIPLFKGEEQANAIEKIEIEENGFSLVAQKDLYQIGDKAVYIQPDYSLSDIPLFDSFIRPFGEPKKSKLGSNYRIRAVKFNLHTGDNEPTYSVGILLPINDVFRYVLKSHEDFLTIENLSRINLTEKLGITKWEEPDNSNQPGIKTNGGRAYPEGVYKTDETNINNLWGHLEKKVGYPVYLIGSEKVDGSSISIFVDSDKLEFKVGSRTYVKPMMIEKVVSHRDLTVFEKIKKFFGFKVDNIIKDLVENDDQFVQIAKPYIKKVKDAIDKKIVGGKFILRGEANGQSWKGSGNKNNPTSKNEPNIKFFGIDDFNNGVSVKLNEVTFNLMIENLGLERCKVVFKKTFNSREEIEKECKEYFKTNMIEGIVLRTADSKFSGKFMNDEYDSKK